jgi:hypothetical protein
MKSTLDVLQQDAPYLNSTRNKLIHIGFLTVFTFIFLTVYSPFNMSEWGGSMLGYVLIGTPLILISQFLVRPLLGFRKFKLYELIIWAAAEILLVTLGIYLIFGPNFPSFTEKLDEYLLTLKYVVLIIASPYFLSIWLIASRQKLSTFQNLNVTSSMEEEIRPSKLLSILGENNKVVFAIDADQIVFIKSSGNYLEINYLHGGRKAKELVRMSLKELEAKIKDTNLIKTHRSYLVNTQQISSFKKTKKGYELRMQHFADDALPVSSGFKEHFEELMALSLSH